MSLKRICVRKEKLKCPKIPHCPKIPIMTLLSYDGHDKDVYALQDCINIQSTLDTSNFKGLGKIC